VAKNKATAGRYKDLVRVVKNLRQETIGVLLSWPTHVLVAPAPIKPRSNSSAQRAVPNCVARPQLSVDNCHVCRRADDDSVTNRLATNESAGVRALLKCDAIARFRVVRE
jgi:hypothetical protein